MSRFGYLTCRLDAADKGSRVPAEGSWFYSRPPVGMRRPNREYGEIWLVRRNDSIRCGLLSPNSAGDVITIGGREWTVVGGNGIPPSMPVFTSE